MTERKAGDHLKIFVDRIERLNEEVKARNEDKRDLYAEAKSAGYDPAALKIVIQRRAKDPDKLSELQSLVETYESALGTPRATRAPARVEPEKPRTVAIVREPPAPKPRTEIPDIPDFLDRSKEAARM